MTVRCERTLLPLGECAESCCRPDLKRFQPIPEVWMRVTEPAGRPVVPSSADVADGNMHALLQVVSGRTGRPDVVEMVRELCEQSAHLVRYDVDQGPAPAPVRRKSKGKQRRSKAGRSAGRAPKYHRTVEPPLLVQLYESVEPSGSAEAGTARPASSRPAARLDAIDTASRIDTQVGVWLDQLGVDQAAAIQIKFDRSKPMTEADYRHEDSMARLRHLASLIPGLDHCGRKKPARDKKTRRPICCKPHELEHDIDRWWTWARVVTGWDTPAWQPANTCPLCGTRGTLRVRLEDQRATCVNDGCRETWDAATIGLLAEHIRRENNDTEESASMTGTDTAITSTFHRPCGVCGSTVETVGGVEQTHDCSGPDARRSAAIAHAYWAGHDRAKQDVAPVDGSTSDGFHTFDELYRHRMLLNAALFKAWNDIANETASNYNPVHKSLLHYDGEAPFGGGWFIVIAQLPTGQISYHYELDHWDLFDVPEQDRAAAWDGHTSEQAADRLQTWLQTWLEG